MTAPLRVVPPSPAQLAANPDSPHQAVFGMDIETLKLATTAVGLGIELTGETVRVTA